ncbi:ATP-binding protein [Nocardia iowensis]|uniref:ATP-binding protein n=1 Tax=Nocardia iowensis TaxID=204891 RepID=A0ABX8RYD1_NOCIO|nr:ATP-binding protein [Nocardia iowensis]QXN93987.1 ATP-binding protein [Nocardia iowensis]
MTPLSPSLFSRTAAALSGRRGRGSSVARAAAEQIDRILAFALGLGVWIFGAGDAAEIAGQSRHFPAWWTVLALSGVFGTALLLAGTALRAALPTVRNIAATHATVFAVVVGLSGFAVQPGQITDDVAWIYRLVPLGGVAATLAWRTPVTAIYLVAVGALAASSTGWATGDLGWMEFALTSVRIIGITIAFVYITQLARRAARLLDKERARAHDQAALAAAEEARAGERARFAGVIHDKVLATLLDTSRGGSPSVLARQADHALGQFAAIGRVNELCTDLEAIEAIAHEAGAATDTELRVQVRHDCNSADLRIDSAAVAALGQAAAEAVRNSVRHAAVPGRTVARQLTIVARESGITVVVSDDGAGFDPDQVAANRLGLTVSIVGRMREAGGRATIDSCPGAGTRVVLEWNAPDET